MSCYGPLRKQGVPDIEAWSLVEYAAVARMPPTTLVVRDPVPLFTHVHTRMLNVKALLAVRPPSPCSPPGGVALLLPNASTAAALRVSSRAWTEHFDGRTFALPFEYDADVAHAECDPALWAREAGRVAVLRYVSPHPPWWRAVFLYELV